MTKKNSDLCCWADAGHFIMLSAMVFALDLVQSRLNIDIVF